MNKRIFGLPYAGGTADFYNKLKEMLELQDIELVPLEYAGHGTRYKEIPYNSISEMAEDMANMILQVISEDEEFYLFGYSMGTIVTIEIIKYLMVQKRKLPTGVVLAAHEPKTKKELADWNLDMPDELIKDRVIGFGGVPKHLVNNNVFWRVYLPIYKNDFMLIGKYNFDNICLSTDIPALVLFSEDDTPFSEIVNWNNYFVGNNRYQEYEGDHFFIDNYTMEVAKLISQWVKEE